MVSRDTFGGIDRNDMSMVEELPKYEQGNQNHFDDEFISENTRQTLKDIENLLETSSKSTFEEVLEFQCRKNSRRKNRSDASLLFSDLLVLGSCRALDLKQDLNIN